MAASGREEALIAMGWAAAAAIIALLLIFVFANPDGGVASTFFNVADIKESFHPILKAFWTNIWVACVSEVLVLLLRPRSWRSCGCCPDGPVPRCG